jgi:hypothetical protein
MKGSIKTTIKQISKYWNGKVSETDLNFDWSESETHCWNCGDNKYRKSKKTASLERCHIIPRSLKGKDIPSNFVLLCKECHKEAPNTTNPNDMWDWIKSNYMPFSFYGTYTIRKALIMFKMKEGYSFLDKIKDIDYLNNIILTEFKKTSTHLLKTNESTYYYMFKHIIDNNTYDKDNTFKNIF